MSVWTLGLNHHTAPLDLRGRFSFAAEHLGTTLQSLRQTLSQPSEAAILSTCNRTEIYGAGAQADVEQTLHWLAQAGDVPVGTLRHYTYALHNGDAARHAFRVASGLDSMVLGEAQILGQMKTAVRAAEQAGALGVTLNQMFQRSFSVAKQVRSTTEIGAHSISMAAAAVRLAAQLFEDLRHIRILFVGAGEMIELAMTHFAARSPAQMVIANRTMQRGEALATRFGAEVMPLADIPDRLHEFDAVVSCTASTLPIIGLGAVERALRQRRRRPVFMVDLAVPRDIEPEVQALEDAYLYTVDDLASVVQSGHALRQAAVAQAEVIIDEGVRHFEHWMRQRDPQDGAVGLIQQIQQQARHWQHIEVVRAQKRLARGDDVQHVLEALAHGMTQKLLHGTLVHLHHSDQEARHTVAEVVRRIFLKNRS